MGSTLKNCFPIITNCSRFALIAGEGARALSQAVESQHQTGPLSVASNTCALFNNLTECALFPEVAPMIRQSQVRARIIITVTAAAFMLSAVPLSLMPVTSAAAVPACAMSCCAGKTHAKHSCATRITGNRKTQSARSHSDTSKPATPVAATRAPCDREGSCSAAAIANQNSNGKPVALAYASGPRFASRRPGIAPRIVSQIQDVISAKARPRAPPILS